MRFRPLPVMTTLALASLLILVWLGQWQWSRFITRSRAEQAPPVAFAVTRLYPVGLAGRDAPLVYGLFEGQAAWRRYVPVAEQPAGPPAGFLLWDVVLSVSPVPLALEGLTPVTLPAARVLPGRERGPFTPPDDPAAGLWYGIDLPAMAAALDLPESAIALFEPERVSVIDADNRLGRGSQPPPAPNPWADLSRSPDLPPARHLGYALTWWGLAGTLIGVYIAFHVSRGRLSFGPARKGRTED